MLALDEARPQGQGRGHDPLNAQDMQAQHCADDVDDGIHRAHLVEVDVVRGGAVNLGLGRGQAVKYGAGARGDSWRQAGRGDNLQDVAQVAVGLVLVFDDHLDVAGGNAVVVDAPRLQRPARQGEGL